MNNKRLRLKRWRREERMEVMEVKEKLIGKEVMKDWKMVER